LICESWLTADASSCNLGKIKQRQITELPL
jgi:hypothetical protein